MNRLKRLASLALGALMLAAPIVGLAASANRQIFYEDPWYNLGSAAAFGTTCSIDSANARCAVIFQATSTDAITHVTTCSASATALGGNIAQVSVQGVDGSGFPDGAILNSGTAKLNLIPDTAWTTGSADCTEHALAADTGSLTIGTFIAIVVEAAPGGTTPDASNKVVLNLISNMQASGTNRYAMIDTNATWASADKQAAMPVFGARASTTTYYGRPITAFSATTLSTTVEAGGMFTTDASWGSTMRLSGVRFIGLGPTASNTLTVSAYSGCTDTSPSQLTTITIDADMVSAVASNRTLFEVIFSTPIDLTMGTTYCVAVYASGGSPTLIYIDYKTNAGMSAKYGAAGMTYVTRNPSGGTNAFTETSTRLPRISLIITDITEPATTGGHPGIIGG